jgi:group I intron endonuclease
MGCGIYKIQNTINNKIYIGSSIKINTRLMNHKYALRCGKHDNEYLQNSFNKYGESNFIFETIELCDISKLIEKENFYIEKYSSNDLKMGYNLAKVNDFRRNTFNNEVKIKNSKLNLSLYGNFTTFKSININNNIENTFTSLVEAADYLINNNFSKGNPRNIRQKLSHCLRGKKVNNGSKGTIRKTAYDHIWSIIT